VEADGLARGANEVPEHLGCAGVDALDAVGGIPEVPEEGFALL